jgi:hypothetical protein
MKRRAQVPTVYGLNQALVNLMYEPMNGAIDPNGVIQGEIGQMYVRTTDNSVYVATSHVAGVTIWTRIDCNSRALGLTWVTDATVGPINLDVNHGYKLTNNAGVPVVVTLPEVSVVGDQIWLHSHNINVAGSGIRINQRVNQYVNYGPDNTALGAAGYTDRISAGLAQRLSNMIILVCIEDNVGWQIASTILDLNLHR